MLAPLDNETIFKIAFTDKLVFTSFVKDIAGIDIEVDRIETEKQFEPKVGNIDFKYDIFAESTDHRVIVEIQRVDYDYNFDRFLHYFLMGIAQLQRSSKDYRIDRKVYAIVVLTAPYKIDEKTRIPVKDEVLISSLDPRNLKDKVVPVYGHTLVFLNHHYRNEETPSNYRDWLDLFYESTHNPEGYRVNQERAGIRRAVELIEYDRLDGRAIHEMKIAEQRKVVRRMAVDEGYAKGVKEGKEEGRDEERKQVAAKMKAKGMAPEMIAELTGLPLSEIEAL